MAWEDLSSELEEEFSWLAHHYDRNDSSLHVSRRLIEAGEVREMRLLDAVPARNKQRAKRRRRWARRLEAGLIPAACRRPGCAVALPTEIRNGAPRLFCSRACKDWRPPVTVSLQKCSAPGCSTQTSRKTCSNRCRQRLWYSLHRA